MAVLRLTALFWRRGGARHRSILGCTAAAVAASVVLALLALSVSPALGKRADRIAWREVGRNQAMAREFAPTAVQHTSTDQFSGRTISRVDLALVGGTETMVGTPPGLPRFPRSGEIFASPSMARLLQSRPSAALGDRYPGALVGTIGAEALAFDDELVVVVGHEAVEGASVDGVALTASPGGRAMPIATFARWGPNNDLSRYRTLAQMAAILLVIPTLLLVGAAARLTAAQRDQRMAALRLIGAAPGAIRGLTAVEVAVAALAGTLAGIAGYVLVLPLAARVELAGGSFPPGDLWLGASAMAATAFLVPFGAACSAVVALRRVASGPLGVAAQLTPKRPSGWRFLVLPLAWYLFLQAVMDMRSGGSSTGAMAGLAAVIVTLSVMGPWVAWCIGVVLSRLARRPALLIAGRRIRADPTSTYRTVSGMVLAGLIAGFLFGVLPTLHSAQGSSLGGLQMNVEFAADRGAALTAVLDSRGAIAEMALPESSDIADQRSFTSAIVLGTSPDELRTALAVADPTVSVDTWDRDGQTTLLLDDLGRASVVMALAALALATVSAAISGSSSIIDQRVTLARLRLTGTPIGVLQRARRWQTLVPLLLAGAGAMGFGVAAGLAMMVAFGAESGRIQPPDVGSLVVLSVASLVAGLVVVAATRPLLVVVSRSTPRD